MFRMGLFAIVIFTFLAAFGAADVAAAPAPSGSYIVVLNDSVANPGAVATQQAAAYGGQVGFVYQHALKGYSVTLPTSMLPALQANPLVQFVSDDLEVTATGSPPPPSSQPPQFLPSEVDRIDGDRSSARSGDGRGSVGINVAVLDSGIDSTHPDLNVVGGTNCSNGKNDDFTDRFFHGSAVAGIIGALDNSIGVVGVAPGARLWAVRVLNDQGMGSTSSVLCGIDFVTASRSDGDATNDITVANMSLANKGSDDGNCGRTSKDPFHLAICNSVAAGVTYVVAAGNDGVDFQGTIPAAYDEVLTVTAMADFDGKPGALSGPADCPLATDSRYGDDSAAFFSNFAVFGDDQAHTVAAPGVCVISTSFNQGYSLDTGTSFAAPALAGTVALCIASGACVGLSPAQIIQKIVGDAAVYNTAHPDYGFGGDPQRPVDGKYYGYLIRAALY